MKRILSLALAAVMVFGVFAFVACDPTPKPKELDFNAVFEAARGLGFEGDLEDLIALFKGDSAFQVAINNGYSGTESEWLMALVGASGKDGKNGTTPRIGDNGNWWIGEVDSGVKAQGERGGDGKPGLSAYEIWLDEMGYNKETHTELDFLNWLRGDLDDLKQQIEELEGRIAELEAQLSELRKRLEGNMGTYTRHSNSVDTINAQLENQIRQGVISYSEIQPPLEMEEVWVSYYFGTFDKASVVMINGVRIFGPPAIGHFIIEDMVFEYNYGHPYRVWYDGEFFSLQEAHSDGILSIDDIRSIYAVRW
jgi:hypothetical protein